MTISLNAIEARILGCLMEKERTTPDYYPLTFNAVVTACNQKSNRYPVMNLDNTTVEEACSSLASKGLLIARGGAGSRVTKFAHRIPQMLQLDTQQQALLGILLVRGAQTVGELKTRSARLAEFECTEEVELILETMMSDDIALIEKLEREPGKRECRYIHTLLPAELQQAQSSTTSNSNETNREPVEIKSVSLERIDQLEHLVLALQKQVQEMQQQLSH